MEVTAQDRSLEFITYEDGLREQWLPTHHCSRE